MFMRSALTDPMPIGNDRWAVEFRWSDPATDRSGEIVVEVWQTGTIMTQEASGDPELSESPAFDSRIVTRAGSPLSPAR